MAMNLSAETLGSVKKSYMNILSLFFEQEKLESRFVKCLLKWAIQLGLDNEDIMKANDLEYLTFIKPDNKAEQLEALYHLVLMIYLDQRVEDTELEVATIYATHLGFRPTVVNDLFKSIVTAPFDGDNPANVKQGVSEFLNTYEG